MTGSGVRCDRTVAWAALAGHFEGHGRDLDLIDAFARDPARVELLSVEAPEVYADLSKNLIDRSTLRMLLELARECGLEARRDAMLAGAPVNLTEGRAVLHTALRVPRAHDELTAQVLSARERMLSFAREVRLTDRSGITDVVHLGIGGSDLGPQMAVQALTNGADSPLRLHFVSSLDAQEIEHVLRALDARRTLFVVASKTFSTQEVLSNLRIAREWMRHCGVDEPGRHLVATTASPQAAARHGITRCFEFWDWVGGRYSMWSSIGLPIALACGVEAFEEMLAGAHEMDGHFASAPLERNLPVLLGLLDLWYRNFHRFTSRSVAPYCNGLRRLPAYLQQLEMESNGKCVDMGGEPLPFGTSPVVWGEPGTNGQHAFFQMLHQGTDVVPVEFIAARRAPGSDEAAHRMLLANCFAQSQALMLGKRFEEARAEKAPTASASIDPDVLARHRSFPGNRPSTTLLIDALTPRALGALVAMYEHRVFTSGALWGINSFDQWGVELGKALCNELLPRLESGDTQGLDASTAALVQRVRR
jgi:glucose-6-phosphate isomerase